MSFYCENCEERGEAAEAEIERLRRELAECPTNPNETSDIIKGLQRVYGLRSTYNIAAVNLSLGGGSYTGYCDGDATKPSIDNLKSVNIAKVIASGNAGYTDSISSPACVSSAVSVGATPDSDTVASYSNSASFLNLLAPGSSINSAIPAPVMRAGAGHPWPRPM